MAKRAFLLTALFSIALPLHSADSRFPEVGDYWCYQVRIWNGGEGLEDFPKLIYYATGDTDFLGTPLVALLGIGIEKPGGRPAPLELVVVNWAPFIRPYRWPVMVRHLPEGNRGMLPEIPADPLSVIGAQMRIAAFSQPPGDFASFSLTSVKKESVTVPAGHFADCILVTYKQAIGAVGKPLDAHLYESLTLHEEGTAWWSDEVNWWVRLEGQRTVLNERKIFVRYTVELTDWGHLSRDELLQRLQEALESAEAVDPGMAETLREQLTKLGWELDGS